MVEQVIMVPVKKMVEVVNMVPMSSIRENEMVTTSVQGMWGEMPTQTVVRQQSFGQGFISPRNQMTMIPQDNLIVSSRSASKESTSSQMINMVPMTSMQDNAMMSNGVFMSPRRQEVPMMWGQMTPEKVMMQQSFQQPMISPRNLGTTMIPQDNLMGSLRSVSKESCGSVIMGQPVIQSGSYVPPVSSVAYPSATIFTTGGSTGLSTPVPPLQSSMVMQQPVASMTQRPASPLHSWRRTL